jgi:MSHA biogenesis protein MshJ
MKRQLIIWRERIDAMKVGERGALFAVAAGLIVLLVHTTMLSPLLAQRAELQSQLRQQNDNIAGLDAEIKAVVEAHERDPDAPARARLVAVKSESGALAAQLRAMQSKLVPAERMAPLLQTILRDNGRLQLVSLKTLPVHSLLEATAAAGAAPDGAAAARPASLIYRHAVEVTVRGNYLDMVNYMATLESMPDQLFWAHADLQVEQYPNARLTLTLYTLSLDQKWMTL